MDSMTDLWKLSYPIVEKKSRFLSHYLVRNIDGIWDDPLELKNNGLKMISLNYIMPESMTEDQHQFSGLK
jgi:hypothetical protein